MGDRPVIWLQSAQNTNAERKKEYFNTIRGIQIHSPKVWAVTVNALDREATTVG
jgi:hypothetical protein